MKIKTAELTGSALDWAVAKALGIRTYIGRYEHTLTGPCILDADLVDMQTDGEQELKHSRSWAQGGPILHRERITTHDFDGSWLAVIFERNSCVMPVKRESPAKSVFGQFVIKHRAWGLDPLEAGMRCFVTKALGDEVDVPEELLK